MVLDLEDVEKIIGLKLLLPRTVDHKLTAQFAQAKSPSRRRRK
jgi:hypothetical protein